MLVQKYVHYPTLTDCHRGTRYYAEQTTVMELLVSVHEVHVMNA